MPGLYRFCRRHGIFFYSQLGALRSQSGSAAIRAAMDLLCRRNLAIYRRTPSFAKTAAVQRELEALRVPCAGVLPVGLDTAIIPAITAPRAALRAQLGLAENAKYILFVGRLDAYKRPLDVAAVLAALPADWQAVVIGQGSLADELHRAMDAAGLAGRWRHIPQLPNAQVHAYYHACDVFLNCNDREIFGMSLLEAMYAGCVPVARHAPGPDEIIEDGVSGFLVGPAQGDTDALAAAAVARGRGPGNGRGGQTAHPHAFFVAEQRRTGAANVTAERGGHAWTMTPNGWNWRATLYKGARFGWKYRGVPVLTAQQGNDLAAERLRSGQPFLFGRCGATEMRTVAEFLRTSGRDFSETVRREVRDLSGVFPDRRRYAAPLLRIVHSLRPQRRPAGAVGCRGGTAGHPRLPGHTVRQTARAGALLPPQPVERGAGGQARAGRTPVPGYDPAPV